ncbi:dual specificity protein phosphatase family protein [Bradyrhizobium sp. BRP22]|uniref:hypothetical protein n=1 Tax=Bradyrhizobium sp. BRP22 TaxID=2793821 RepID=UPI001CD5D82F|nr:hypothetical protein [Bradyrhizobium sp. BRP22]MCA1458080.1 dual specificity protein phosphatase family protein [Bradyrhizobium sp. BRP22]
MIEVAPNLFVGNALDYENHVRLIDTPKPGWAVVHAAKEPWHRAALGYTGRGAPKDHEEYLFAFRGDRLCLNLVDVDNVDYVNKKVVEAGISFIGQQIADSKKVLVHCNQGQSRGPGLALLYLGATEGMWASMHPADAMLRFTELYPMFSPANGMAEYVLKNWPKVEAA